ncbi:GAF domain-containing sensor histidine kinase [Methanoculleus taiwanensis]|uniref:GAF domain-containing sensor histidine kinase n=1 Tax=Methanoculleus taiwanensis TaxID=1550565 RepID=UPI000FFE60F6|nr:GAF domain-containing sensor histidine kinase [Methanoculleus taiwanensis]
MNSIVLTRSEAHHREERAATAEEALRQQNRHLTVLNRIVGITAASGSLDAMLTEALERVLTHMGLHCGMIYLLDAGQTEAAVRYSLNVPEWYLSRHRVLPVDTWPCHAVLIEQQPHYIGTDTAQSPHEEQILKELEISSLACIPLIAGSVTVGAIFIGSREDRIFTDEEKILLEAIGREVGSGIHRMQLSQQLEAANREANLYLDILTHDIRNALNVSTLYADLLLDLLDREQSEYARKFRASIYKSIEILENVSTIRRIYQEAVSTASVDLDGIILESIANFPDAAIRYECGSHRVVADPLLAEVFANLLGNATKFGGPGVTITIRIEEQMPGMLLVTVEDTGPGVPDDMKEAIFYRFEQGKHAGRGEGLGLYITKTLVERYGGEIRVDDRVPGSPAEGAAFRFTLKKHEQEYT